MKTEFIDVSDTKKNLVVEIPSTVVDAEIDKVSRDYSRAARIPGFRPGKVPPKVVRQRFRDQILHDVAHGLIPRAVDEALRERGVVASMSRAGDCYDNAVAESFFATLRAELVDHGRYPTRAAAVASIGEYIDGFYNVERRHSSLGYLNPIEFELRSSSDQQVT